MSIHDIRKRFVRDNKFQIPVIQSPYFEYFLSIYNESNTRYEGIVEKYNSFIKEVEKIGEEAFVEKTFNVADKVVEHINKKESYQHFNTTRLDSFNIPQVNISSKDIFNLNNDGKMFLSIDLKQANFHALKYFNPLIVDSKNTYEEFISQFTDIEHIIKSKYVRQVIFGKLNPKRISKIETFITYQILQEVLNVVSADSVKFFSHDEIVLAVDNANVQFPVLEVTRKVDVKSEELGTPVKYEIFELKAQNPHKKLGFVKQKIDGTVEFKGVQDIFFAQAFKKYFNLPIEDNDLMFYHEGQLAKFLHPIEEEAKLCGV